MKNKGSAVTSIIQKCLPLTRENTITDTTLNAAEYSLPSLRELDSKPTLEQ